MLAEAERLENDIIRASSVREIELLKKTISTGQVKAASYYVDMPSGKLNVIAFSPSYCFIATECFGGEAQETKVLRQWRDSYLLHRSIGREFVVWYYKNGESIAGFIAKSPVIKYFTKLTISIFSKFIAYKVEVSDGR